MGGQKSEPNQTKVNQSKTTSDKLQTIGSEDIFFRSCSLLPIFVPPYLYAYLRAYSFACASV